MSERSVTSLIVLVVVGGALWTLFQQRQPELSRMEGPVALAPEMVPLVTGDEPLVTIFTKAGCPACHTIPGIAGARGLVGPPLIPGKTGRDRLRDASYHGRAQTVHEYVVESVLEPGIFVVPGYPPATMPTWYGSKLSALALEKIASYLEGQGAEDSIRR